ncbi:hypothetical protein ACFLQ6_05510 [Thermoproteota archaeon]
MLEKESDVELTSELKIDRDIIVDEDWIQNYVEEILSVCKRFNIQVLSIKKCNSKRKGIHFYIKINPPIDPALANKLQWLLGDDDKRVAFNRARIESGLNEWNKLFEKSKVNFKIIYEKR